MSQKGFAEERAPERELPQDHGGRDRRAGLSPLALPSAPSCTPHPGGSQGGHAWGEGARLALGVVFPVAGTGRGHFNTSRACHASAVWALLGPGFPGPAPGRREQGRHWPRRWCHGGCCPRFRSPDTHGGERSMCSWVRQEGRVYREKEQQTQHRGVGVELAGPLRGGEARGV